MIHWVKMSVFVKREHVVLIVEDAVPPTISIHGNQETGALLWLIRMLHANVSYCGS